jgi:adenine-specific DNA-methyltransferase
MMTEVQIKGAIRGQLEAFAHGQLAGNARALFDVLGYHSEKRFDLTPNTADVFRATFDLAARLNPSTALLDEWRSVDVLFQLTGDEITNHGQARLAFDATTRVDNTIIQSYLFLAIGLRGEHYTRTQLANVTREVNKLFPMPVMILFQYGACLTFAIINRRLHKRDDTKDVLEKVTLIKDIVYRTPHRAHLEILFDLSLDQLHARHGFANFVELHNAWQKTLDTSELNKRFFREVANWYFWAVQNVRFPAGAGADAETRNATSMIRLITRLIFVWFLKEKGLVPDRLFDRKQLAQLLNYTDPQDSTYYKAVLQNLFFATLNQEMNTPGKRDKRDWRKPTQHYGITNLYRYRDYFRDSDRGLAAFADIPFLNGGLFECLDKRVGEESSREMVRIDGFSDRPDNELIVPDFLFFGDEREVDLNTIYDTLNRDYRVRGLIAIFDSYKFTVAENTPIEEEIALDPELLGKVFENLLAAYNPETGVTARKQTGSFYTPREIVDYMVDESLIAYLLGKFERMGLSHRADLDARLRQLFTYTQEPHQFTAQEVALLINAIDHVKILDPACGSGAFPMGILHKLVFILRKLDFGNILWRERQVAKAARIDDPIAREQAIIDIGQAFERNELDYGRKLYLVQNCVCGVDIQPIAVQIAKLRFFISLVADQRIDDVAPNRGILPLPNLETNFVAANTLIGIPRPHQLAFRNQDVEDKERELAEVRRRHFAARTETTKKKYRAEDKRLREDLAGLLKKDGWGSRTATLLATWDPYDQNASAEFFDPEWMFGLSSGFDITIGNPPYIKEYTFREAFDGLRHSPYYQGKMDLWYFFACVALDMLRPDTGVLSFIATNNWVTNAGASILRNKVVNEATILKLIDFGNYKIFESSDIQTMVLVCLRNSSEPKYVFDLRKVTAPQTSYTDILDILSKTSSTKASYLVPTIERARFRNVSLVFSENVIEAILEKLATSANFCLDGNTEVAQGIVTPQDAVNNASRRILGNEFEIGDGIFVLSSAEKNAMHLFGNELQLIKPFYTTVQLHRYYGDLRNSYWVIYTDSSFKNPRTMTAYPNIRRHLDQFQAVITSDNRPYGLHRARDERFFKGAKILSVRKCAQPTFTYTEFDCYVAQTFNIIRSHRVNLKFLTGVLNSKVVAFWLRHKGKMQGYQFQIDKEPLLAIPLVVPATQLQTPLIELVDQLLEVKRQDSASDVSGLEEQIDGVVYRLYDLTPEEIALIEEDTK